MGIVEAIDKDVGSWCWYVRYKAMGLVNSSRHVKE